MRSNLREVRHKNIRVRMGNNEVTMEWYYFNKLGYGNRFDTLEGNVVLWWCYVHQNNDTGRISCRKYWGMSKAGIEFSLLFYLEQIEV